MEMLRKKLPVLLVRVDANPAIGTGHMMRCLALSKAWQNGTGTVSWLVAENITGLDERLYREDIPYRQIDAVPGSNFDADHLILDARNIDAAWIVVDGYRFEPDYIRMLKRAGLRVLFIDDDGRFDWYAADVILNQNVSAYAAMYKNRERFTDLLLGPDYALLRPEFLAESRRYDHESVGQKVLVTMGGSDPENVTEKAVRALSALSIDAKIVIGGWNVKCEALRILIDRLSSSLQIERSPPNMAQVMRWADVAISAAGSTCCELMYMGLPAIVIPISKDQSGIAQGLAERGIVLNLGWHADVSEEVLREALISLLHDHRRRVEMSERGRELIDGQGARRVVTFLQDFL